MIRGRKKARKKFIFIEHLQRKLFLCFMSRDIFLTLPFFLSFKTFTKGAKKWRWHRKLADYYL